MTNNHAWTGPTKAAEGMHQDLEWLALNVSEWASQENLSMARKSPVGAEFYDPEYRPYDDGHTKHQWLQARKDLGLVMSDEEEEMEAEEWSQTITDTKEEAEVLEGMTESEWAGSVAEGINLHSSGGDNDYWIAKIDNPKRLDPYQAECEDLIELFQMTFQEGEAFKALWRKGQLRIGNGKPGDTLLRNSQKAYHYSGRMVAMESGS